MTQDSRWKDSMEGGPMLLLLLLLLLLCFLGCPYWRRGESSSAYPGQQNQP